MKRENLRTVIGFALIVLLVNSGCQVDIEGGNFEAWNGWDSCQDSSANDQSCNEDKEANSTPSSCPRNTTSGSYGYTDSLNEHSVSTNGVDNRLLVTGNGETLLFEYNGLTYVARINWTDGSYVFAPDADGSKTGDPILCVVQFEEEQMEGDCFRRQRVCHFTFYDSREFAGNTDVYRLGFTDCRHSPIGPFLVPLESPLCGEEPFPACPSVDLTEQPNRPEAAGSGSAPVEEDVATQSPEGEGAPDLDSQESLEVPNFEGQLSK